MKFTKPDPNDAFTISSDAEWPSIAFETDATGAHTWNWTVAWGNFTKSGKQTTPDNKWDAKAALTNYGGTLTVRAEANNQTAVVSVKIKGVNPSGMEVTRYLASKLNSDGFDRIIEHESKYKHFNASGEPIKSFDNGYGLCQLTNPIPSFDKIWNWKLNVDAGLSLYAQKYNAAVLYLSQNQRAYTKDQLLHEAVCRWNGGSYHEWDGKAGLWKRHSNILCDSKTGNIGWDMTDKENQGKTESELHNRDSGSYSHAPEEKAHWKYFGVCYADSILG